jgi:hypothetical protein
MTTTRFLFAVLLTPLLWSASASGQQFDPAPSWPLCGRITDAPPAGWDESLGCPQNRWGNTDFTDLPLNWTYGPRPLTSENDRYDFHRGLDIATPIGTPVFAIAAGEVKLAGVHSSYSDPVVQIRHFRPGHNSCDGVGCYHSNYMHMSGWAIWSATPARAPAASTICTSRSATRRRTTSSAAGSATPFIRCWCCPMPTRHHPT